MEQKREIVYEVSEWSQGAPELLQSWSRQEILQILCAEMGKERKYTGLTKVKIIEILLKVVADKKSREDKNNTTIGLESSENGHGRGTKRQRKTDHTNQPNVSMDVECDRGYSEIKLLCKNSACRAKLSREDAFCKRCSCCICHQYDDNKDPSLWLSCSSDAPYEGKSCGMSCHLECELQHEKSGIPKDEDSRGLDGCFYCLSCGKVNDLLQCWRKQMTTAKDTRRVDILCYRVSLGQKLLTGTVRYRTLAKMVNEAIQKLEADVGPLTGLPVKRARGIINRLSSGQEVQRLCAFAIESLDSILSNTHNPALKDPGILTPVVKYENICPTSIFVILDFEDRSLGDNLSGYNYTIWHRKAQDTDYPSEPTCSLLARTSTRFLLSGLSPSTQYVLKIILCQKSREFYSREFRFQTSNEIVERSQSLATNSSGLSNPSTVEDENRTEKSNEQDKNAPDAVNNGIENGIEFDPFVPMMEANLPITPYKPERSKDGNLARKSRPEALENNLEDGSRKEQDGSSWKKRSGEEGQDRDFGYYVKVIRWLECKRHIDTSFRQKFLTWYSLRASPEEVRIVKVFINTLMEDPASLAGQLVDTFSEAITSKKCSKGLCLKLFH
ncbi:hypothetical protein L6452_03253 [Arctium lappa]|uniref:Uncharacterized protein n=1 Tax=Arctium lappa TaxID=4217 RepID=A0ACB9FLE0_ARCLA|nr:hypothetical protein L6452_03253 [Arctium lappa]